MQIRILSDVRFSGRWLRPGDTADLPAEDAASLIGGGSAECLSAEIRADLSDLGLALDLVAVTFDMEVQEVCAVLAAHVEQRDTGGAAGIAPAPSADGLPPTEGPEAAGEDVPDVKTGPAATGIGPVEQPQETPETGAAGPASALRKPARGGTKKMDS